MYPTTVSRLLGYVLVLLISVPSFVFAQSTVNLTLDDGDMDEEFQGTGSFTVTRDGSTTGAINVFVELSGSAVYNTDFTYINLHGYSHPTWKVVNPLRKGVHANLGWHTLSLQMPAENKNWEKYADDFPQAFKTIEQGIAFLQKEKGITTIYLMGHSMGSRMASAFIAENPDAPIQGLIVAGIRNNGGYPLDGMQNLKHI